jgi:hypothetical protein
MSARLKRHAPVLIVLAILGYLCWPYLGSATDAHANQANKGPEIAAASLSPHVETAFNRDPFKGPGAHLVHAPPVTNHALGKPASKPALSSTESTDLLNGLALNATFLRGSHRSALINGALYAEGDQVKLAAATPAPVKIARVLPDKVLLQCADQTLELTYASRPSKTQGPPHSEPAPTKSKPRKAV